ncbi:MAG: hypothetical protein CR989_00975 [Flavobacteriales bacterium]|nr:MAG: hypothetical protein CR989_00975 [Flavobacteriales bacterium]
MAKENYPQNEEIDLNHLFKTIGKGIQNFFKAIGNCFTRLFHYFILFLIFLRNNALKLFIAIITGAIIGGIIDYSKPKVYTSFMIVEPNFNSAQQLYKNIEFYHELVRQKDSVLLSEALAISMEEANQLKGFYIEPIQNQNEIYESFNEFVENADSTTVKNMSIENYRQGFADFNYKYHKILVKSKNNNIFEKLTKPIINSVENNSYFKNQKKINDENLIQNEKVLLKSMQEVDTLRKIYNTILIIEAQKPKTGTNISMAREDKKTNELKLFNESLNLNKKLVANNKDKAKTTDILNVVSSFSKVGIKERSIFKKYTFLLGVGFGALMFLFILLGQLNRYLKQYGK